jgi:phage tail sheath gpL-like
MSVSTAVDLSAVARVVGIKTEFKNLQGGVFGLPQRIAVIGQGNTASTYSTDKLQVTSAIEAANIYGFGSPIHLCMLQLFPSNGDGVGSIPVTIYPLDDDESGVASSGTITPSGSQTEAAAYRVVINNIQSEQFVINVGDSVATITAAITEAINAVLEMPVTASDGATVVNLTSKWKGESANDIVVSISGSTTAGTVFAISQPSGGLVNPDVDTALSQVGNVWETLVLNCLNLSDTTTLDKYSTFGEGRWGALTRKPLVIFTGTNLSTVALATAVSDARKTDRTNAQLVEPAGKDLPFVIAARQLARIAKVANNDIATDFIAQKATGLIPGPDGDQWDHPTRDSAVKKGSSTIEVVDGVVNLSDTITFYHPTGDPTPAYRYVVDIVKLQNILYNVDLVFSSQEWAGKPLIPNEQPTTNRNAKKPSMAVAEVYRLIDAFGLLAIISDPEAAKETVVAQINETNPKRLDIAFTVQLSGNTNIISIDFNFGFYFGTSQIVG